MSGEHSAVVAPGRLWHLTPAAVHRLWSGAALVLAGLLTGRPDVAALGVPLALTVVWGLAQRSEGVTTAELDHARFRSARSRVEAVLHLQPAPGIAAVHLRVGAPGHRAREVLLDGRRRRALRLWLATARTGRLDTFIVDHLDLGAEVVRSTDPGTVGPARVLVLPQPAPLADMPLPSRLQGLTGPHRSRRPGEGGDLRDIAPFAPGDRLRRIDWKTTARRAASTQLGSGAPELYVRRTFATSEASVLLVLDARDAVGPDVSTWSTGEVHPDELTSLDIARHAAASIAKRYLDQGDRVGLIDPERHRRLLRPAGGRRQLHRVLHQLALSEPHDQPSPGLRAPRIPSGALVVVLSTFLDDHAAWLAGRWRSIGHHAVAVDVLPSPSPGPLPPKLETAWRIVKMERAERLSALAASGVDVVAWDDDSRRPTVQVALATLARARRRRQ